MARRGESELVNALKTKDLESLRACLRDHPELARTPRAVVEAGRLAWKEGLAALEKTGADLNASWRKYRALHSLIQEHPHVQRLKSTRERLSCLDWLLRHGADPDQLGAWPPARAIVIAAFVGDASCVAHLRKARTRVDGFVSAALGDVRGVERATGKNRGFAQARDDGGLTALQCAVGSRLGKDNATVRRGLLRIAGFLLDRGADPNARTRSWGQWVTPAYFAAGSDQKEMFTLLLERGADAASALTPAVWESKFEFVERALLHGAKIDKARDGDKPLLNQMIRWGQVRQALWLLERGASPNIADERGWTAVHQAASRGNERMMRAVLEAGGNRGRRDAKGLLAVDVAEALGRSKMAALLRGKG